MHLHKIYFVTFLADFICISDCALLAGLPKLDHRNVKRKNITWKNENIFSVNDYKNQMTQQANAAIKSSYKVPSNRPEFHFIRHFKHKRRKQLEKQKIEHRLKESVLVLSEQKSNLKNTRRSNKRPNKGKQMKNQNLLKSLLIVS